MYWSVPSPVECRNFGGYGAVLASGDREIVPRATEGLRLRREHQARQVKMSLTDLMAITTKSPECRFSGMFTLLARVPNATAVEPNSGPR